MSWRSRVAFFSVGDCPLQKARATCSVSVFLGPKTLGEKMHWQPVDLLMGLRWSGIEGRETTCTYLVH